MPPITLETLLQFLQQQRPTNSPLFSNSMSTPPIDTSDFNSNRTSAAFISQYPPGTDFNNSFGAAQNANPMFQNDSNPYFSHAYRSVVSQSPLFTNPIEGQTQAIMYPPGTNMYLPALSSDPLYGLARQQALLKLRGK